MQHEHHRVPVTALAFFRSDVILTGEGNYLNAYNQKSQRLSSICIFPNQAIHGIVIDQSSDSTVFVYGDAFFRIASIHDGACHPIHRSRPEHAASDAVARLNGAPVRAQVLAEHALSLQQRQRTRLAPSSVATTNGAHHVWQRQSRPYFFGNERR